MVLCYLIFFDSCSTLRSLSSLDRVGHLTACDTLILGLKELVLAVNSKLFEVRLVMTDQTLAVNICIGHFTLLPAVLRNLVCLFCGSFLASFRGCLDSDVFQRLPFLLSYCSMELLEC